MNRMNWILVTMLLIGSNCVLAFDFETLRSVNVLFVGGMNSEKMDAYKGRSFANHIRLLREHGVQVDVLDYDTGGTVQDAVPVALEKLKALSGPTLLVSHSMGGPILLEALLQLGHYEKIAGWIAVQAPFYGAKKANFGKKVSKVSMPGMMLNVMDPLRVCRKTLLPFMIADRMIEAGTSLRNQFVYGLFTDGSDFAAFEQLTTGYREKFMRSHRAEVRALGDRFPILSVTSKQKGKSHDGMVEVDSMWLPNSLRRHYRRTDHFELVFRGFGGRTSQESAFGEMLGDLTTSGLWRF